jgi:putative ABC transport system permease protein
MKHIWRILLILLSGSEAFQHQNKFRRKIFSFATNGHGKIPTIVNRWNIHDELINSHACHDASSEQPCWSVVKFFNQSPRRTIPKKQLVSLAASLVVMLCIGSSASAAPTLHKSTAPAVLGARNIASSAALLVSLACLPLRLNGMGPLAKALAVSASRCALQVSLLGSVVLQKIMGVTQPFYVVAWVFGVGILAGRESIARIQYTYPNMERNMYLSILISGLTVLGLTMGMQLLGNVQPWFDPRTWVSIAGMLFGNTLNASALGAATITKQFATHADAVEMRLARGATIKQALHPLMEESYRTALTPTINGLAATGIIHIPGMMSGQILAGQSPQQAALYQIMINFLIATVATFTCQLVIISTVHSLVNMGQHRLQSGILKPKMNSEKMRLWEVFRSWHPRLSFRQATQEGNNSEAATSLVSAPCIKLINSTYTSDFSENVVKTKRNVVLELQHLMVTKAGISIDNLILRRGDRVAVTGRSGVGKSQLLRTIVGLEESGNDFSMRLFGESIPVADFRKKIFLVPQKIPNLEGTPRQLFLEFLQYHGNLQPIHDDSCEHQLLQIAKEWGLEEGIFDQPWKTLSGGQAQRVSLAIALSLKPEVLMMDESTNALDEASSIAVEKTLIKSEIPIIVVTHERDQLNRFCTHQLNLL